VTIVPEAYEEDLAQKHLPVLPGQVPTEFVCKPLSRVAINSVSDAYATLSAPEAAQVVVSWGLKEIKNGLTTLDVGQKIVQRDIKEILDRLPARRVAP